MVYLTPHAHPAGDVGSFRLYRVVSASQNCSFSDRILGPSIESSVNQLEAPLSLLALFRRLFSSAIVEGRIINFSLLHS